jgi:hypothetical protein
MNEYYWGAAAAAVCVPEQRKMAVSDCAMSQSEKEGFFQLGFDGAVINGRSVYTSPLSCVHFLAK